jgi:putative transposase
VLPRYSSPFRSDGKQSRCPVAAEHWHIDELLGERSRPAIPVSDLTSPSPTTGEHLIAELDRLASDRGNYPTVLRCDNGPELACGAMSDWSAGRVALHFIPPGEPWRNGYVESFNSRIRDECLNINSFWSLAQARVVISHWKHEYNHCESCGGWSGTGWQG